MRNGPNRSQRTHWAARTAAALGAGLLGLLLVAAGCGSAVPATPHGGTQSPAGGGSAAARAAATKPAGRGGASGQLTAVPVALGSLTSATDGPLYVADSLGFFRRQGIRPVFTQVTSASASTAVLVSGKVDVADVGNNPATFNALADGVPLRLVADNARAPVAQLLIRRALRGTVRGPADLRGRTIAITPPGIPTAGGYVIATYLAKAGLTLSDVHIAALTFAAMVGALKTGQVDAAMEIEPFATEAIDAGIASRLVMDSQVVPGEEAGVLAYTLPFIQKHPHLAERFMVAYLQGVRTFYGAFHGGADRAQVLHVLTTRTAIKKTALWAHMVIPGVDPLGRINVQSFVEQQAFFHRLGLVKKTVAVPSFVDEAFIKAADRTLGPLTSGPAGG